MIPRNRLKSVIKRQSGFTLMELLVVIAIIVILTVLLIPVLSRSKNSAQRLVCASNLKQVGVAAKMYVDEHESTFPNSQLPSGYWRTNGIHLSCIYKSQVKIYLGLTGPSSPNDKVFACPADKFYNILTTNVYIPRGMHEEMESDYSSYFYNTINLSPLRRGLGGIGGLKESDIAEPVKTVLICEAPAPVPYSWHKPQAELEFNNARNQISFVDGHVDYIAIYYNSSITNAPNRLSQSYDPPPSYQYRWSAR